MQLKWLELPRPCPSTRLRGAIGVAATAALAIVVVAAAHRKLKPPADAESDDQAKEDAENHALPDAPPLSAHEALIGHTPLVLLARLSHLTQRKIYAKMESLNPGGTGKDRAALAMIRAAEAAGELPRRDSRSAAGVEFSSNDEEAAVAPPVEASAASTSLTPPSSLYASLDDLIRRAMPHSKTGGLIVEGTSGSTGISLALLARAFGHACVVVMPDDQSKDKVATLEALGAVVHVVPTAAYASPRHYVNLARRTAIRAKSHFGLHASFADQFENSANYETHFSITGPELWRQCGKSPPDAFVMSAGTGGTIAGVGHYFKVRSNGKCRVVLVDPPGSALYHRVVDGVAYAPQQSERSLRRHRYDTVAEGIGLDRVTRNFALGLPHIDHAIRVSDQETLDMAHWLLEREGLWVGSSSAMNVVGAVRTALDLPVGSKVVTVVCDGGPRHVTRFWNRDFCASRGLYWPEDSPPNEPLVPDCLRGLPQG